MHVPSWYGGSPHVKPTGDSKWSLNVIEGDGVAKGPGGDSASGSGSSALLPSAGKSLCAFILGTF